MLVMGILFLSETIAFGSTSIVTSITVDENVEPQIRLNFNITLMDLHCDFVAVDVWDALGTNRQNVTKNVDKWQLDETGRRRIFSGRNRDPRALHYEEHDMTVEEMHEEAGVHAVSLNKGNFEQFLKENPMAFLDLYAPWYVHQLAFDATCMSLSYGLFSMRSDLPCGRTHISRLFVRSCVCLKVRLVSKTGSHVGKVCSRSAQGRNARGCRQSGLHGGSGFVS